MSWNLEEIVNPRAAWWILRRRLLGWKRRTYKSVVVDPGSRSRMEEPRSARLGSLWRLTEGRDVVENPERASVGRDHQIVTVDGEISDGSDWQVQLQCLPLLSVVKRHVDSQFGCGEEQSFGLRILPNGTKESSSGNAVGDQLPSGSIVERSVDVRGLIIESAAIHRRVSDSGIEMRRFDQRDFTPFPEPWGRDIFPRF